MGLRIAGILLLLAGWFLMLAALFLLRLLAARTAFVFAGFGVEAIGFVLLAHSFIPHRKKRDA